VRRWHGNSYSYGALLGFKSRKSRGTLFLLEYQVEDFLPPEMPSIFLQIKTHKCGPLHLNGKLPRSITTKLQTSNRDPSHLVKGHDVQTTAIPRDRR